jgi:hypothetical protein
VGVVLGCQWALTRFVKVDHLTNLLNTSGDQSMKELHKSYLKDRTDCESNVLYVRVDKKGIEDTS